MSCNGCRVLRKGCSEDCSIRPCLEWIKNPESQANATVFLAKFYGRAGLMNLINAGPQNLRPGSNFGIKIDFSFNSLIFSVACLSSFDQNSNLISLQIFCLVFHHKFS